MYAVADSDILAILGILAHKPTVSTEQQTYKCSDW